jgi:hypothetical protein
MITITGYAVLALIAAGGRSDLDLVNEGTNN